MAADTWRHSVQPKLKFVGPVALAGSGCQKLFYEAASDSAWFTFSLRSEPEDALGNLHRRAVPLTSERRAGENFI
ncbi:hypothetical protein CWO91_24640 [Bradyrhizobium genosp. SA-3]|nr:hypothetical protein CWO91_24640 [Bradyrhizobium genosp. SA-3]